MRLSVVPVPGVPAFDGIVVDCPGVGAGAGPVPLGDAVPPGAALPVEPAAPDDAPPVLPPLDPPVWANVKAVLAVRNATAKNATLVCLGCIAPSCDRRPPCACNVCPAASVPPWNRSQLHTLPPRQFLFTKGR